MLILCIIVFSLAFLQEFLRAEYSVLEARYASIVAHSGNDTGSERAPSSQVNADVFAKASVVRLQNMRTVYHVGLSFVSLLVMTVFMSLNVWIVAAVLSGTGAGFHVFQRRRAEAVASTGLLKDGGGAGCH
ncbi:hypothetical protein HDU84_006812 [Entophlyctis sp. JEL0112]|nr:hypothetical protein HDU84_006812 [Entophlyctis sp. JEL0112]